MIVNAIWDLDGTLYDTYPEMLDALTATFVAHGVTVDQAALLEEVKHGAITDAVARVAAALDVLPAALLADYHQREAQTVMTAKPYQEARQVLEAVVASGGNNLLMTHRDDSAWALLAKDHLDHLFLGGVTATLGLPRKPKPDAVLYLLERHQLNPLVTAMIGDRQLDVVAGQAAGVQGVYFNVDGLNDAPMADIQLERLVDLLPHLKTPL